MTIMSLTQQLIDEGLHCPPDKKRTEVCDAAMRGLYAEVRAVNPSSPTWYYRYKDSTGKTCHQRIGAVRDISLAEARRKVKTLKAEIELGADPRAEAKAQKAVLTVKEYFEDKYLPYAKARKRSYENDESMARLRVIPKFGHLRRED